MASNPGPPWWVEMGLLGDIDPSTNLLRSYDTGQQQVGQTGFHRWNFWFQLDAGLGQTIQGSILSSNATINVMIDENTIVGPLIGPFSRPLNDGRYYVLVTTTVGVTTFHFGIIAVPPLSLFTNDAGRSQSSPLNLGTLTTFLGHKNSFYTYFPRKQITTSSGPGQLIPDFSNPTPYAPSPDWYSFDLPVRRRLYLRTAGSIPGPTYVIFPQGVATIWSSGHTIDLDPGRHLLAVYDQKTRVVGGENLVTYRDPNAENFEHYQFDISISA